MKGCSVLASFSPVPSISKLGHQGNEGPFGGDLPRLETDNLIDARREWNGCCALISLENGPLLDSYLHLTNISFLPRNESGSLIGNN